MFCPQCKAEYRQGFTRCADCEIDLVEALMPAGPPSRQPVRQGTLVRLWAGDDLALHAALLKELESAGIPFFNRPVDHFTGAHRRDISDRLLPRPAFGFEVEVLSSDLAAAQGVLQELAAPPE